MNSTDVLLLQTGDRLLLEDGVGAILLGVVRGEGQLPVAGVVDSFGGSHLQFDVQLGWRSEGEADC